jgi:hypothetical protein
MIAINRPYVTQASGGAGIGYARGYRDRGSELSVITSLQGRFTALVCHRDGQPRPELARDRRLGRSHRIAARRHRVLPRPAAHRTRGDFPEACHVAIRCRRRLLPLDVAGCLQGRRSRALLPHRGERPCARPGQRCESGLPGLRGKHRLPVFWPGDRAGRHLGSRDTGVFPAAETAAEAQRPACTWPSSV